MWKDSHLLFLVELRGQGGGRPGKNGVGGVRGAKNGILKVAGSGRERGQKLRSIAQYFAVEIMQRDGSQQIQRGNRD